MRSEKRRTVLPDIAAALRQARPAFIVLALGLSVSVAAWRFTDERVRSDAANEFQQKTARAIELVDRRVQTNIHLLVGLRGLFDASEEVTRDEFRAYLSGFNIERGYSGVRVVSYGERVMRADRPAFEQRVRQDISVNPRGYPSFAIKPPGERDEYVVINYIQPIEGNEAAFGLDLAADPVRLAEIVGARDSGKPVASGPFAATVDPSQISFAVRSAIYRRGMPLKTVAQRREAFQGVVAVVIHVNELINTVFGEELGRGFNLMIYDVGLTSLGELQASSRENFLYDSSGRSGNQPQYTRRGLKQVAALDVGGRRWWLTFTAPARGYGAEGLLPAVVFLGGILTSLLLFWLVWALVASRARALKIAEQATAVRAAEGLREQLSFIQQLIETVPQPIYFKDSEGRNLGVNKAWEKFLGMPREKAAGKNVFELYPDDPELAKKHRAMDEELLSRPGSRSYEATVAGEDGKVRHAIYNKATFFKPDGSVGGLIGTITDVTGLKQAEAALRESEARFRDLTELSSDWYWEQDADLRFTQVSSRFAEFNLSIEAHIGKTRWELPLSGVSEEQWRAHRELLSAHKPFQDFVYQRHDNSGNLRTISVSGRPIFGDQGVFKGYRGTGRDITEQKRAEEQIRHMAHHDALSGLPNRVLLDDRVGQAIAQARRGRTGLALLFIDLDRFKMVNDSLGHPVGDRLLRTVAERLGSCVRNTDTVARIGGDEFVVLLTALNRAEDARYIAQKIIDTVSERLMIDDHELHITPSIGICVYPHDGQDAETLMRNADTAMYHAKEMGRNNYQFFTRSMNIITQQRLVLENDLRRALEHGELSLHYQPQVDLRTGAIVGFEALARWRHPERGMVAPSEFIPAAEESGLINPIGEFVLRQACSQARAWQAAGFPQLQVAVNCSAKQFRREGMVEAVARLLEEVGLSAECLELEITESVIIQHAEQVIDWFRELNDMGLQLSIDDFGTGYSSLSYLKRFPIQKLKIDQSFVRDIGHDPDDAAIVRAIVAMAHSLGLEVIAEGVETAAQLAFLKSLACDKAQGYYFSKPLPADEFLELLRNWDPAARGVAA
jgi:diguanylate cyclase (GGDEF)-like protein/PAS domain S-box-containing protein